MASGAKTQDTAKQAAKPQEGSGEPDLSMEEILQSIRKIIAEDDDDSSKVNGAKTQTMENVVPGSDVLELTEMVKDDGTVVSLKPETPADKPAAEVASNDVLTTIDQALAVEKTPEKAAEKPVEKPAEKLPAKEPPKTSAAPPEKTPEKPAAAGDAMLSADAAEKAAAAFKRLQTTESDIPPPLTTPAPSFRSGTTVEDMVYEMLRPMMKAWLDVNLPPIVERIVEREVHKLTRR